jgi:hypothetical protein
MSMLKSSIIIVGQDIHIIGPKAFQGELGMLENGEVLYIWLL